MHVLIVDADERFRENLAKQLARRGMTVQATGDPGEARRMACRERTGVVLVGLSSSHQTLLSFLRNIRQDCPKSEVILINHSGDVPLSIEAMKHGALDEVGAPVDLEELLRKLDAVAARRADGAGDGV
jgi:Response regulator containing CheY-like receiver, AAA-type ATPase, and DNA-binding domains